MSRWVLAFFPNVFRAFVSLNIAKWEERCRRFFVIFNATVSPSFLPWQRKFVTIFVFDLNSIRILPQIKFPFRVCKLILIVLGAPNGRPHVFFFTIRRLPNPFSIHFIKSTPFSTLLYRHFDNAVSIEMNWTRKLNYLSRLSLVLNSICVRNTNCGG